MPIFFNKLLFLCLLLLLTACGTSTVELNLIAQKHLNQDVRNNSLPVLIRVYTLTSDDEFTDATFRELWHNDKSVLGNTLIDREEYSLNPNSHLKISVSHDANAKFIAVVALFRRPRGSEWRVIRVMPGRVVASMRNITIILSGSTVQIK